MTVARLDPAALPDARGHFGRFGGRLVPETLMSPLIELERAYRAARRDRAQAALVGRHADGVIVGSAIVRLVEQHAGSPDLPVKVGEFVAALKAPLRGP